MVLMIENECLKVSFSELGGELTSIQNQEDNIEYLWQGNPEFWGRQAPVLFPNVGRLKDDSYRYEGVTYYLGQHGFARDQRFTVKEHTATRIAFSLLSNEESRKVYPFEFELILSYELVGNQLICSYHVENTGKGPMYFSIGGHPAFNVPLGNQGNFEDYFLRFAPKKSRLVLPLKGPYIDLANKTLGQTNTDIALTRALFKNDAIVYETVGTNSYSIKSDKTPHSVTVSYDNMPYVGIWSPYPLEAPFVCIEPWCGVADTVEATGELTEKLGINHLASQEIFKNQYTIEID